MKVCNVCKKELPDDSRFCQYCGSKDVIDKVEQNVVLCEDNKRKPFSFKTLILLSLLILSLGYNFYVSNQISELKKDYEIINDDKNEYRADYYSEHSKYTSLISSLENMKSSEVFSINKTILSYPNNEKLLVTKLKSSNVGTIYSRTSSSLVTAEWGEWIDDDTCELFITCKTYGVYSIQILNEAKEPMSEILIINE